MQLVAGYFELFSLRKGADQSRVIAQSHQHVLQLATAVATAEGFESAAMNLCNELATRTGASRVAIGWLKGKYVRVKALSNTEKFDKKQELIVQIEKVMEECVDQEEVVKYDPTPGGKSSENVTRAAAELSRAQGGNIVLSLPLRRQSEIVGVATLEFSAHQSLGENAASGLAIAVDLLAPQLYDRHMNDRWLVVKTGHSIKETAKLAIGPKFMLAKVIIVAVIALGAFMTFYKPMYHVSAPVRFVPVQKLSLSAPYDGHLKTLAKVNGEFVGPSTKVKKGQVLAELDTSELVLQRGDAMAKANAQQKEADADYAKGKIAEYTIAMAQREQWLAQAKLYQHQIDEAKIVAPYVGEILQGDLRDKIGAPVKQGDVLFEIADRSQLEAELKVSDRDIRYVHVYEEGQPSAGTTGTLVSVSDTQKEYPFKISRIVPVGEAQEGSNVFKAYATLNAAEVPELRPGLTGQARIAVKPEPLIWIWTHKVIEFLRLELWV
jgi:multidrug efflux pump subunit AcrA (membrane-fusion protein)